MRCVLDEPGSYYCIGGKTGICIRESSFGLGADRFKQQRAGLHHLGLRMRSNEDVDQLHAFLKTLGVNIVRPPESANWAPGYYSVLFEDPDGIRIEANHVPGKGLLGNDHAMVGQDT